MIPENTKGGLALDLPAKTKNRFIYRLSTAPLGYAAALLIVLSLFMDLLIEALGRRSLIAALGFMTEHPILFLYNSLIKQLTLFLLHSSFELNPSPYFSYVLSSGNSNPPEGYG